MSYSRQLRISGPSVGNTLGDKGGDYAIIEPGGIIIGEAYHCIGEDAYRDAEANARLWAAASDLRAALEALLTQLKFAAPGKPEKVTIKDVRALRIAADQALAALAATEAGE
jgi:hypothetical protein